MSLKGIDMVKEFVSEAYTWCDFTVRRSGKGKTLGTKNELVVGKHGGRGDRVCLQRSNVGAFGGRWNLHKNICVLRLIKRMYPKKSILLYVTF